MITNRIAVIGSGPAGISASIQLHRYGFEPDIYEFKDKPGLLRNAFLIENYPGFPHGISGKDLYDLFRKQHLSYVPNIIPERVLKLQKKNNRFFVFTSKQHIDYDYVVIAAGTRPIRINEPYPQGRIFYEVSEIPESHTEILIAGGGDAAFDYALNLENSGKRVTILCRSSLPKCLNLLKSRTEKKNIKILYGQHIHSWKSNKKLEVCIEPPEQTVIVDCLLAAFGREPELSFLDAEMMERMNTNQQPLPRLYLAGDVRNGLKRQVGIAVGDGLSIAMEIKERINR